VHYPMDHEFNPMVKTPFHFGSGRMALLAVYAAAEGKFWDVHDLLYQWAGDRREIDLRELAARTGLPADRMAEAQGNMEFREKLAADVRWGMQHGIQATPSYLIGGKVYQGTIPPEAFKGIVD
jgi:protein-disulfide isomerase